MRHFSYSYWIKRAQYAHADVHFVLGGPGSGKGTMCELLARDFDYQHISAGELLRNELKKSGPLASVIQDCIQNGQIVDGRITCSLIQAHMKSIGTNKSYLIDGFPRNYNNVNSWYEVLGHMTDLQGVLYLTTSEEVMMQ